MSEQTKDAEKFVHDNRAEVERILAWVNGFIERDDLEGAQNCAVLFQNIIGLIGHYIVSRVMEPCADEPRKMQ